MSMLHDLRSKKYCLRHLRDSLCRELCIMSDEVKVNISMVFHLTIWKSRIEKTKRALIEYEEKSILLPILISSVFNAFRSQVKYFLFYSVNSVYLGMRKRKAPPGRNISYFKTLDNKDARFYFTIERNQVKLVNPCKLLLLPRYLPAYFL